MAVACIHALEAAVLDVAVIAKTATFDRRLSLHTAGIASHASCLNRQASMSVRSWAHHKARHQLSWLLARETSGVSNRFQFSNLPTLLTARSRPVHAPRTFYHTVMAPPAGLKLALAHGETSLTSLECKHVRTASDDSFSPRVGTNARRSLLLNLKAANKTWLSYT